MAKTDPVGVSSAEQTIEHKAPLVANLPWRARVAMIALIIVIVVLLVQVGNKAVENGKLQKKNSEQLEKISQQRTEEVSNLAVLLQLVGRLEDAAKAQGAQPAVTVEGAVEALKKSGFRQDILDEAAGLAQGKTGPSGPPGPPGPAGTSAATTTSTVPATTTSTTRPPTTTTSTTRPNPTTTTRCLVSVGGLAKLGC